MFLMPMTMAFGQVLEKDTTEVTTQTWDIYWTPASFRGGNYALQMYLRENIRYPLEAKERGIEGRVMVSFIVEKDGSITDVKVAKSSHKILEDEAVRVVSAMPKWSPGREYGQVIRQRFIIPVVFER